MLLRVQGEDEEGNVRKEKPERGRTGKAGRKDLKPKKYLVAMRPRETPVPIPNTTVKTRTADGTALETVWESRWLPDYKKETGL